MKLDEEGGDCVTFQSHNTLDGVQISDSTWFVEFASLSMNLFAISKWRMRRCNVICCVLGFLQ